MINIFDSAQIKPIWENTQTKSWVKLIDSNNLIDLDSYDKRPYFKKVANIIQDVELNKVGLKKRSTVIRFESIIEKEEWDVKTEWIYLLVINGKVVKIGGTRDGLNGRTGSYLCGHHIPERGKSGDCSKTNGFIYNTLDFYLNQGATIELWGYKLPVSIMKEIVFGEEVDIIVQTYHAYESKLCSQFIKAYGSLPALNDNFDPNYK